MNKHGTRGEKITSLILDGLVDRTATFNGVSIPGRLIEAAVAPFTQNVIFATGDETYPVILRGSGTAIRFNQRELLVCTQHQLGDIDRSKVGLMAEGGGRFISSAGVRHYDPRPDTDANDIVAFDFTAPVTAMSEFRPRFFNLAPPPAYDLDIIALILVGFPFADQNYDVEERRHIETARRVVICTADPVAPADGVLARAIPSQPLDFNPDGMSGGSAYMLAMGRNGFEIHFAGIIVRGGREGFYLLKAGMVSDFLRIVTDASGHGKPVPTEQDQRNSDG